MTEHVLKVEPPYGAALADGTKTFEVRRNDRSYQAGDKLTLLDGAQCRCWDVACDRYVPIRRVVSFVYSGDPRFGGHGGLQPGYVVLGLQGGDQ